MSSDPLDSIKIDDIVSSKIDPETIFKELERLKVEVNILRNDMLLFLRALATIPDNQSQQEYYNTLTAKLNTVRASIHDYCTQYNRLLPVINLAQIKLGQEAEVLGTKESPKKTDKKRGKN